MAAVTKRKEGQWRALVRRRGFPTLSGTFKSQKDAEAWAREVESSMDRRVFVSSKEAEQTTLREALERYRREVTPGKRSAHDEHYKINTLLAHPLANRYIASIKGSDVAKYRDARLLEVAPATVLREMALLSHLFTIAHREWGMESLGNPVKMARKPLVRNQRNRRLQDGEEAELLRRAALYGGPVRSIIVLALETAMRRSELVGLLWQHVDLKRRIAHLPQTKNGKSRDVPLSMRAVETLLALPRRLDGRVFGIREDSVTQAFSRITGNAASCKRSSQDQKREPMTDLHFHDLRHEATSRLFEKGLTVVEVQAITGHSTVQMLARYTHLRAEDILRKLG